MVRPNDRRLFVEGGGDNESLKSELRRAFSKLFEADGNTCKPRVIASGSRKQAYDDFCEALKSGEHHARLLVDAEELVAHTSSPDPWAHVLHRQGDQWTRPNGATDDQLHLMTATMETWLLSDHDALTAVLGTKLDRAKLPAEGASLESRAKTDVNDALKAATKDTSSGKYLKARHSFKVLERVRPAKLRALPWACRFLDAMKSPSQD